MPVGGINRGMKGYGQRYLRARAEISAGEDGDIYRRGRRYLRTKAKISTRNAVRLTDSIFFKSLQENAPLSPHAFWLFQTLPLSLLRQGQDNAEH